MTLLAYKDSNEAYELLDDREPTLEFLAGSKDYILEGWGKRNRQLIKDGFQREHMRGGPEWQHIVILGPWYEPERVILTADR